MKKFFVYVGSLVNLLIANICLAAEKFEILPDLPEALAQSANATTVSKGVETVTTSSVGHEPTVLSVVLSLAFVVILIYATGILYTKLNRAGFNVMKNQKGNELARSQAIVISTTQLGNNKTLHVIELDGKRMLIGASNSSVQLIKDLGVFNENIKTEDYSNIEIPNIKIPNIEIPKIEIPSLKLSKIITKVHKEHEVSENIENFDDVEISTNAQNIVDAVDKDVIIDTLFSDKSKQADTMTMPNSNEHKVDPDEYALYMKYIKK